LTSENSNSDTLQKQVLNSIQYVIVFSENENLRTRSQTFDEMVEKIRKMIEEEVKKCY